MMVQGLANQNSVGNLSSQSQKLRTTQIQSTSLKAQLISVSSSAESLSFEGRSSDGDEVSLSLQSVKFQKKLLQIEAEGDPDSIKKMISYIKDQLNLASKGFSNTSKALGIDQSDTDSVDSDDLQVPEYWNAENTSQRIVDFALSFFESSGLEDKKFLEKIKDAVDKGFNQAKKILGDLPDNISKLNSDTYDLVMNKLDSWIKSRDEQTESNNV